MLAQKTPNNVLQSNQKRIFPSLSCMSFALVYFAPMLHLNRNAAHIWFLLVVYLHAQKRKLLKKETLKIYSLVCFVQFISEMLF